MSEDLHVLETACMYIVFAQGTQKFWQTTGHNVITSTFIQRCLTGVRLEEETSSLAMTKEISSTSVIPCPLTMLVCGKSRSSTPEGRLLNQDLSQWKSGVPKAIMYRVIISVFSRSPPLALSASPLCVTFTLHYDKQ